MKPSDGDARIVDALTFKLNQRSRSQQLLHEQDVGVGRTFEERARQTKLIVALPGVIDFRINCIENRGRL